MIKGLTPRLNEAGKIKIGGKGPEIESAKGNKFRPPIKFDHFKITTTERDNAGDLILDTALIETIKKNESGLVNKNGDLVGIPIRFLYNNVDLNFYTKYVSYVGGTMSCHGDGEVSRKGISEFKKDHPCPCPRIEPDYSGKDKCKFSGTLTCIIDEAGLLGQAHKFRTTSENTVKSILGGIKLIETATRGRIAGLPLMLTVNPKTTVTPSGQPTVIHVVSVCYRGSMADLRKDSLQIGQEESQYLIGMTEIEEQAKFAMVAPEAGEEAKDFASEFFPNNSGNSGNSDQSIIDVEHKEVKEVKEVKEDSGTQENAGDIKETIEEGEEIVEVEEIIGTVPDGPYATLYDSLLAETDLVKAIAMVKRLQKDNILFWISQNHPDVEFDKTLKKPGLIEIAESLLMSVLGTPETEKVVEKVIEKVEEVIPDRTLPGSNATKEITIEAEKSPVKAPQEWDKSGPITKIQLRELVGVKKELETSGALSPDPLAWEKHVNYFLGEDGKPLLKANKMTTTQGDNFLRMLKAAQIPF